MWQNFPSNYHITHHCDKTFHQLNTTHNTPVWQILPSNEHSPCPHHLQQSDCTRNQLVLQWPDTSDQREITLSALLVFSTRQQKEKKSAKKKAKEPVKKNVRENIKKGTKQETIIMIIITTTIIIMSVFLKRLSIWNMLSCAEQTQTKKTQKNTCIKDTQNSMCPNNHTQTNQ